LTVSSSSFFGCSSSDEPQPANSAGAGAQNAGTGNCGAVVSDEEAGGVGGASGASESESSEACPEPHVFSIKFDYRFDRAGYFDAPERRAALEAAAAAWSARLSSDFPSVPAGTKLTLVDPEDREQQVTIDSLEEDIDDLLVFVGTSEAISDNGQGGPAGFAETSDPDLQQSLFDRQLGKPFQPWAGSISFKGSIDYFFDETPETRDDLPEDQPDFISLATHELGHVLGFAACPAFIALEKDGTFRGKAAFAAYGGPVPLEPDLGHFAEGTESDGVEALMTPSVLHGVRREPTTLDLATFVDIGYVTK
jgi:hypothetical protein